MASSKPPAPLRPLPRLIFASRWLQLPLYLGLIAAQGVYVFHFWVELVHLHEAAFGNQTALQALVTSSSMLPMRVFTALSARFPMENTHNASDRVDRRAANNSAELHKNSEQHAYATH